MRARGPKASVSSLRVGPCQTLAIGASAGNGVARAATQQAHSGIQMVTGRSSRSRQGKNRGGQHDSEDEA